jgi:hypothetical protein
MRTKSLHLSKGVKEPRNVSRSYKIARVMPFFMKAVLQNVSCYWATSCREQNKRQVVKPGSINPRNKGAASGIAEMVWAGAE